MAVYTISPFLGPVLGPLISGFINQNTNWRWTYYTQIIWTFVELVALVLVRITQAFLLLHLPDCFCSSFRKHMGLLSFATKLEGEDGFPGLKL